MRTAFAMKLTIVSVTWTNVFCNGPGAVLECGCEEIPAGACDCEGNLADALGVRGGSCQSDTNLNGICDGEDVLGCTYQDALNFEPDGNHGQRCVHVCTM